MILSMPMTIMWTETHAVGCICGACNNTACLATMRVTVRSLAEYDALVERLAGKREGGSE